MIVCSLLSAMSNPDVSEQNKLDILMQSEKGGNNALMIACKNKKPASESVLTAVSELTEQDSLEMVLMHLNDDDENVLMLAARDYPILVPNILHLAGRMTLDKRVEFLCQLDKDDNSALHNACKHSPDAAISILSELDKYTPDIISNVLTHINKDQDNALTLLCRSNGSVVPNLLHVMRQLHIDNKLEILTHCDKSDCNPLILSCIHQPTAVANILEFMKIFTPDEQKDLVTHLDKNKWNALMHASNNKHRIAVESLLQAGAELVGVLVTLLTQTDDHKKSPKSSPVAKALTQSSSVFSSIDSPPTEKSNKEEPKDIKNLRLKSPLSPRLN
jgi:ankyrin repeat protein